MTMASQKASQTSSFRTVGYSSSKVTTKIQSTNEFGYTECIQSKMPTHLGYYTYSSKPKYLQTRPKYRSGHSKPKYTNDFYNMMWDPHVYRGPTFKTFQDAEKEREHAIQVARNKLSSKKVKVPPRMLGGIEMPNTPPMNGERSRVPTERFLEEIVEAVEEADATTQTDIIDPKPPLKKYVIAKLGFDISTEMAIDDLFNFDEEVEPIVETLADKVLEQSLLEVMEEEELVELRAQQNAFEERRRIQLLEEYLQTLREQELFEEQAELLDELIEYLHYERQLEDKVTCMQFSHSYLLLMIPKLLENLTNDGFVTDEHLGEITETLKPWLNAEVICELEKKVMSRDLMDDILHDVVDKREAEIATEKLMKERQAAYNKYFLLPEGE